MTDDDKICFKMDDMDKYMGKDKRERMCFLWSKATFAGLVLSEVDDFRNLLWEFKDLNNISNESMTTEQLNVAEKWNQYCTGAQTRTHDLKTFPKDVQEKLKKDAKKRGHKK